MDPMDTQPADGEMDLEIVLDALDNVLKRHGAPGWGFPVEQ